MILVFDTISVLFSVAVGPAFGLNTKINTIVFRYFIINGTKKQNRLFHKKLADRKIFLSIKFY